VLRPDFWFDAADQSTITILSGNVTQWNDKSGNARNLSTASDYPTYSFEKKNGLNVVSFSSSSLAVTGLSISYTAQSTFCAFRPATPVLNARIWTQSDAGTDWQTSAHYIPIVRGQQTADYLSWLESGFRSTYNMTDGAWAIADSVNNGLELRNALNGNLASPFAASAWSKTFTRFGMTASFSGASVNFTGDYAECIVLPLAASFRERSLVQGYLSHKWAIPLAADHPFANRPPLIGD
jgi:hypothetical protein